MASYLISQVKEMIIFVCLPRSIGNSISKRDAPAPYGLGVTPLESRPMAPTQQRASRFVGFKERKKVDIARLLRNVSC